MSLTWISLQIMYNILLLCLGRHPIQNPHYIKPDVDKLPKSVVDQIPLVLYIPPPPGETTETTPHVSTPAPAHAYPPKSPTPSSTVPKRRFMFFRRKDAKSKKKGAGQTSSADSKTRHAKDGKHEKGGEDAVGEEEEEEDVPWDEMWEKSEYPFVRLEGNRAVCAICLMDFEEPKRVRGAKGSGAKPQQPGADAGANAESGPSSPPVGGAGESGSGSGRGSAGGEATQEIQVEAVTEEERDALGEGQGESEGEGPEPLRLLACGHVFHVSNPCSLRLACATTGNADRVLSVLFRGAENVLGPVADGRVRAVPDLPATGGDSRTDKEVEGEAAAKDIVRRLCCASAYSLFTHLCSSLFSFSHVGLRSLLGALTLYLHPLSAFSVR